MQRCCLSPTKRFPIWLALTLVAALQGWGASENTEPQASSLRVPAFTAYLTPNPHGAWVSPRIGISHWNDPAVKVLWFGKFRSAGKLHAAVELRLPAGASTRMRLSLAGVAHEAEAVGKASNSVRLDFGLFQIPKTGYQRFTLESLDAKGAPFGDLTALWLRGPCVRTAHFNLKPRRNAASVHLFYTVPEGIRVAAFYCEVTGLKDPPGTYYMACGWHRGYFGMQVNSPTERRIIFSVWDSGHEPVDRSKVARADRVQLVAKGRGVYAGSFGNEGTGGHSHLVYPWKTGEKQRFLVTANPVDQTHTIYAGYYFQPEKKKWILISSWKAPKDGGYLHGLYSFSEDFDGSNGQLRRKALYGNQWIRTASGRWRELKTAMFSCDTTGKADRLDRFMGIEKGQFFLSQGGFIKGFTAYGTRFTRPATGQPPMDVADLLPASKANVNR